MAERTCTGFVISVNQRVVQNLNIEKEMEQRFREVMLKIDEHGTGMAAKDMGQKMTKSVWTNTTADITVLIFNIRTCALYPSYPQIISAIFVRILHVRTSAHQHFTVVRSCKCHLATARISIKVRVRVRVRLLAAPGEYV